MIDELPDLEHLIRQRKVLVDLLRDDLTEQTLADLHRRAQQPAADAFGGGQPEVSVLSSPDSTPVERAAFGRPVADPVLGLILSLFNHLGCAVVHAVAITQKQELISRAADSKGRGRESSLQGECGCCGRDVLGTPSDRLRCGYCEPCYRAWLDAGKPGSDPQEAGDVRGRWENERRGYLREVGRASSRRANVS